MSAWLSFKGFRQSHIFKLDLGTSTKLLHQSAVSSIPNAGMFHCFFSCSTSFLIGSCNRYDTCHNGIWYVFCTIFYPRMKMYFKSIQYLQKHLNLPCYGIFTLALAVISFPQSGPAMKYSIYIWICHQWVHLKGKHLFTQEVSCVHCLLMVLLFWLGFFCVVFFT